MAENSISDKELIAHLLRERDELYRRATKAEHLVEELSDADAMKQKYENELASQRDAFAKQKAELDAKYLQELSKKEDEIRTLTSKLEYAMRKLWGKMSEKRQLPENPQQLKFDFGATDLTEEEKRMAEAAMERVLEQRKAVKVKEHTKLVPVRHKLPENLRHEEEHVYPEGYLGHEDEWILFKETETSEHLEVTAPDIYVRVTVRHKAMRKSDNAIITATAPAEPLAKSYASASLLTELIIGKYADHIPFYRQINMYKRYGVELKQATLEGWFHGVADLMLPLYLRLKDYMLGLDYLQSDESTVPVVNNEKHRTVKGYMWLARSVIEPLVLFHYHEGSRGKEVALEFFDGYKGAIQVDGYPVYDLLDKLEGIIILCCWAHARRYFDRALKHDKKRAEYAIEQIGLLYSIETMADEQGLDHEARAALRQELSYPIIRALEAWALSEKDSVLPKSPIGKAIGYLLNHIRQLSRYTSDGRYKIDNNPVENSVRPLALGRKNYLFCGNHDAAEDSAVIYSLIGCCNIAGVDVRVWLNYFLVHVHDYDNDYSRDLIELLPHNLRKAGRI